MSVRKTIAYINQSQKADLYSSAFFYQLVRDFFYYLQ